MAAKPSPETPQDDAGSESGPADGAPHYLGHRERLRARFRDAGADAVSDYELLELVLFRAIPQRDVKPLVERATRVAEDASRVTALAVAQAENANPLYHSYLRGFDAFESQKAKTTLASAIQIGNPVSWERAIRTLAGEVPGEDALHITIVPE